MPSVAGRCLLGALLLSLAVGCGLNSAPRPDPVGPRRTSTTPTPSGSSDPAMRPSAPDAGAQPQTTASPVAVGPAFDASMAALWRAVQTGDSAVAASTLFPLGAYVQVKTVAAPAADWQSRLMGGFSADIRAAHALVGPGPAELVGVQVPAAQANWVRPGTCANRVGYWHVAGARLLYSSDGVQRSFGIASLISWRGTWYVVHLGAVLRVGTAGVVDRPSIGAGTPGPPGGC